MDWIDEVFDKLCMKKMRESLISYLRFCIMVGGIAVIILTMLTSIFCNSWITIVLGKYEKVNMESYSYKNSVRFPKIVPSDNRPIEHRDRKLVGLFNGIEFVSPFIYTFLLLIFLPKWYYKNKLEPPMELLKEEAKHIAREDYSFECSYPQEDEMGSVCDVVNNMRIQMIRNQTNMWKRMEDQSKLNAAFAHDLRTPLTVLKGYIDLILKYYPQAKITEEKMMQTLCLMKEQLQRLEEFGDTMKEVNRLEEIKMEKKEITIGNLSSKIEAMVYGINTALQGKANPIVASYMCELEVLDCIIADEKVVLEVLDNLLSNAIRYAKGKITIALRRDNNASLELYVRDDGRGFTREELSKATLPYYSSESFEMEHHFGIGLNICKILCEKHGGTVSLMNSIHGGAIVCASFFVL